MHRDAVEDARRFAREEGVEAEAYVMDAPAAKALKDNDVVIIEEMNRVDTIFRRRFEEVVVENTDPEKTSISFHVRYDPITGSYYRMFTRPKDFETVTIPINFRSIMHTASTLWLFTKT